MFGTSSPKPNTISVKEHATFPRLMLLYPCTRFNLLLGWGVSTLSCDEKRLVNCDEYALDQGVDLFSVAQVEGDSAILCRPCPNFHMVEVGTKKYYGVLREGIKVRVAKNHRFTKFACWFPVYFVARLLRINPWSLSPSQETEVFQDPQKIFRDILLMWSMSRWRVVYIRLHQSGETS